MACPPPSAGPRHHSGLWVHPGRLAQFLATRQQIERALQPGRRYFLQLLASKDGENLLAGRAEVQIAQSREDFVPERRRIVRPEAEQRGNHFRRCGEDLERLADLRIEFAHRVKPGPRHQACIALPEEDGQHHARELGVLRHEPQKLGGRPESFLQQDRIQPTSGERCRRDCGR